MGAPGASSRPIEMHEMYYKSYTCPQLDHQKPFVCGMMVKND